MATLLDDFIKGVDLMQVGPAELRELKKLAEDTVAAATTHAREDYVMDRFPTYTENDLKTETDPLAVLRIKSYVAEYRRQLRGINA